MNAKITVRRVLSECVTCKRIHPRTQNQIMAELPPARFQIKEAPFSHTGVDLFGPFVTKVKCSNVKRYGCLFTCMTIRAIHLELAFDLSTSSFINCLRRFLSRRGNIKHLYSDNATNFVGSERVLNGSWNETQIRQYLRPQKIEWSFNCPSASHTGGVWERMIRFVREILLAVMPKKTLTDDELHTLLLEIESIINSRPLTDVPLEPNETTFLTPNHLVRVNHEVALSPFKTGEDDCYSRQRFRLVQFTADEFWKRWIVEYPRTILIRSKWHEKKKNFLPGDVVFLLDTPRFAKKAKTVAKTLLDSRKKRKLFHKPWITRGIFVSIRHKQKMYKSIFVNGNEFQKKIYKQYSNKLTKVKFLSKQMYYREKLSYFNHDQQKIWNLIKSLLPSKSKTKSTVTKIKISNSVVDDPSSIVREFNDYFCDIGKALARQLPDHQCNSFMKYMKRPSASSMFLDSPQPPEILNIIRSLSSSKSCGFDNIPTFFLNLAADILAHPLALLFKSCFALGLFPDKLKIAKIIPVLKKGDRQEISNYRPISILSCLSKILEKLIYVRTVSFLNKNSILIPTQYGFRNSHSTTHALLDVVNNAYNNINDNNFTALIFIDLKKAFDTVNHSILIRKLSHYGIRGIANDLFSSYLHDRKQFVKIENVKSDMKVTEYGVPQGSALGPLLFLLYVNDLSSCSSNSPRLFADDTCLIVNDSSYVKLIEKVNEEIRSVSKWMNANKLTINMTKSNILVISPKLNKFCFYNSSNYPTTSIPIITTARYLGIILDDKLSFQPHIKLLEGKLSRSLGILRKVKPFLSTSCMLQLYYSFFHSHLQYGILLWGSTSKTYLSKIKVLQNKAIKVIGGGKWRDRATPFYKKLKILKIVDIYKLETAIFMYKYRTNKLPAGMNILFQETSQVHTKCTRTANLNNYFIPFYRTNRLQNSIQYQGAKLWNSIDPKIRNLKSLNQFKTNYKFLLLNDY